LDQSPSNSSINHPGYRWGEKGIKLFKGFGFYETETKSKIHLSLLNDSPTCFPPESLKTRYDQQRNGSKDGGKKE
jgi:hypothetical protein